VTPAPLRRNRDFLLLQVSQLVSSGGSQITAIAYPLLVLSLTGSSAKAGLVAFARLLPMALFALPAGLAADHWNRRRLMIAAHAMRAAAVGTLGVLVALDDIAFWVIPVVAFVEGSGAVVYSTSAAGAFRAVVPKQQLPDAIAVVTGREATVSLAAPPVGGALFGLARALPFLVHAVSYAVSTVLLAVMRTPFQEEREVDAAPLRTRVADGFRFLWAHPFLRTCAFLFGLANFIGPGVILAIVVIAESQGLTGGQVGLLVSAWARRSCSGRSSRRTSVGGCRCAPCSSWSCGPGPAAVSSSSGRTSTCLQRASCRQGSRSRPRTRSCTATSSG